MKHRPLAIRLLTPAAGLVAMAATALPAASPLRIAPVALFLAAGPGFAALRIAGPALNRNRAVGPAENWDRNFERDSDRIEQFLLIVLLSLSASVIVATALIAVELFSGLAVLALLTLATMIAACCPQLPSTIGKHRSARAPSPPRKG